MDIRIAQDSDVNKLTEMVNNMYNELDYGISFDEKWTLSRVKSKLFLTALLCENNEIKGFCLIKLTGNEYGGSQNGKMGFLYELYIEPESRKKGYAKALLNFMENELIKSDIDYMELYVAKTNETGLNFWQKSGYGEKYKVMAKRLKTGD